MEAMVSIVVPTYNREKELGRAIHSILQQTYVKYEIIIVDDGSTDHTMDAVQQFEDDRIRYIRLEQNQGAGHARNVGIQEARYDYIAFLDSDDEWLPDKLRIQMAKLLSSEEKLGMVYCRMGGRQRHSNARFICPPMELRREVLEGELFDKLLLSNVIGTPTLVLRKECLEQVGGFKESLLCLEDWELILRIARHWRIGFVDEILVEVHKLDGSISTNIGGYLVARCYMVSLYRKEMLAAGVLEGVRDDVLKRASAVGLREEMEELLTRDFDL